MRSLLVALATALLLAGCFGPDALGDPRVVRAESKAAFSAAGWAYDGAVDSVDATVDATFNDADNAGSAILAWNAGGVGWRVEFDQFAEAANKSFMDGGIEFDLTEHGDSGVADASIPKILALVAAWGEARVSLDGEPLMDPTGSETWSAHVMASDTTVRGADGKIANAAGGAYDPAKPADARRTEGDRQLLFALKPHPRATPPTPVNETFVGESAPAADASHAFPAEFGGTIRVTFTAGGASGTPVALAQGSITLVSPSGTEVTSDAFQVTPAGAEAALEWPATEAGDWTLRVTGQGPFSYNAAVSVEYPAGDAFVTLTWDDYEIT